MLLANEAINHILSRPICLGQDKYSKLVRWIQLGLGAESAQDDLAIECREELTVYADTYRHMFQIIFLQIFRTHRIESTR